MTGVQTCALPILLVYLLLAERAIEIVADRGLDALVPARVWSDILAQLAAQLQRGDVEAGLLQALEAIDGLLRQHFPLAPGQDNPNELPDAVIMR